MRIAQVAPLHESVPPKLYGGTERVVYYLTEELVQQGHEVTLFASGDSLTQARLVPICPQSLRLDPQCMDRLAYHMLMLERVYSEKDNFDVIHFHIDYLHYPLMRRQAVPAVTTLHGRLDIPDLVPLYREFQEHPAVSISDAQRQPLPWLNWQATVYHGLNCEDYGFCENPGKYLAFLGRISPEKGLDKAIEIARRVGMPLKIAAKIDKADQDYFDAKIKHLLNDPLIEYVGELAFPETNEFLRNAYAFLFPIQWPEPFGLVMIESMAAGTPVIAYARGSVPEVMDDGVSGFVVRDVQGATRAIERISSLDRIGCRKYFELRFNATRMCRDYVAVYEKLVHAEPAIVPAARGDSVWLKSA